MENTLGTIHITYKGRMMDTLEKYYIFGKTNLNYQINEKLTVRSNIIFKTIVHKNPHRGLLTTHNP